MKKKVNPIIVAIVILIVVLFVIIYLYMSPTQSTSQLNETKNTDLSGVSQVQSSIQTIENTLSSSGEISSAVDEKLYLHASYYFEDILVDKNVYIEEGTNIIEYTNGTYLTAPYDCVITNSSLPNESEICTTSHYVEIQSIETLSMNLSVSETDINKIEVGDVVDITITATNEKIQGNITSISEVWTYSSSGSYFTSIVTFENNGNLKIGMSATCEIIIESAENVVAVPKEAVQTSDSGSYVIVVDSEGNTSNVTVETGISNDAYIEIKSGITENTTVQMQESTESSSNNSGFGNRNGNMRENMGEMPAGFSGGGNLEMPMSNPGR